MIKDRLQEIKDMYLYGERVSGKKFAYQNLDGESIDWLIDEVERLRKLVGEW